MHIGVFGATGGLGRHVVAQAIEAGHTVRALARSPEKLQTRSDRLVAIRGDIENAAAVREVVDGCTAVISALGFTRGQTPEVFGRGMRQVVDAMNGAGVRRLISVSGAGLDLPGDEQSLGRSALILLLKLLAGKVLRGKALEWEVIRSSDLDWTLVRPGRLVEGPGKGRVVAHLTRAAGSASVAYADVAAFMLAEVDRTEHLRQAPIVSGA